MVSYKTNLTINHGIHVNFIKVHLKRAKNSESTDTSIWDQCFPMHFFLSAYISKWPPKYLS